MTCLLAGLLKAALKAVNYEKNKGSSKTDMKTGLNSWSASPRLSYDMLVRTSITTDGKQLFMSYFFSQGFPKIRVKLRSLQRGPLIHKQEILALAFQMYRGRDERAGKQNTTCWLKPSSCHSDCLCSFASQSLRTAWSLLLMQSRGSLGLGLP